MLATVVPVASIWPRIYTCGPVPPVHVPCNVMAAVVPWTSWLAVFVQVTVAGCSPVVLWAATTSPLRTHCPAKCMTTAVVSAAVLNACNSTVSVPPSQPSGMTQSNSMLSALLSVQVIVGRFGPFVTRAAGSLLIQLPDTSMLPALMSRDQTPATLPPVGAFPSG